MSDEDEYVDDLDAVLLAAAERDSKKKAAAGALKRRPKKSMSVGLQKKWKFEKKQRKSVRHHFWGCCKAVPMSRATR